MSDVILNHDFPFIGKTNQLLRARVLHKYGLLYNWYAATDSRKISSSDDWILPSSAQFVTLQTYLGGETIAGGKMKETGTTYWQTPNTGATNESGFNGRGSSERSGADGSFAIIKQVSKFWCTDLPIPGAAYTGIIAYYTGVFGFAGHGFTNGESIRLLYVGAGTPTSYTGNNGRFYTVVKIGGQYWVSANLAETNYRNGDSISEVTDQTTWIGLTSGALCAYNNDWNNV